MSWCVCLRVVVIILFESCRGLIGGAGRRKAKRWPGMSAGLQNKGTIIMPCAYVSLGHLVAMQQVAKHGKTHTVVCRKSTPCSSLCGPT